MMINFDLFSQEKKCKNKFHVAGTKSLVLMIKRDNNSYIFSIGGKQYELKPNFLTFRFTQGISLTLSISDKHKHMYIGGNMEKT